MTFFSNIAIANSLSASDAKSLYESGCSKVIDLRCAPCQSARPVEEMVVRRLENYRIGYDQFPIDGITLDNERLSDFRSTLMHTDEEVVIVSDIPAEIAREIYLQREATVGPEPVEPLQAVA